MLPVYAKGFSRVRPVGFLPGCLYSNGVVRLGETMIGLGTGVNTEKFVSFTRRVQYPDYRIFKPPQLAILSA